MKWIVFGDSRRMIQATLFHPWFKHNEGRRFIALPTQNIWYGVTLSRATRIGLSWCAGQYPSLKRLCTDIQQHIPADWQPSGTEPDTVTWSIQVAGCDLLLLEDTAPEGSCLTFDTLANERVKTIEL